MINGPRFKITLYLITCDGTIAEFAWIDGWNLNLAEIQIWYAPSTYRKDRNFTGLSRIITVHYELEEYRLPHHYTHLIPCLAYIPIQTVCLAQCACSSPGVMCVMRSRTLQYAFQFN
jgi:hypothetical protein